MNNSYVSSVGTGFFPDPSDNVMDSMFKQYERVIVESLITSFGLDFIINDRHGGDVDTIHNVRQIDKDDKMVYKDDKNLAAYRDKGDYDTHAYHSDKNYIDKNREVSRKKDLGALTDAYTGKIIPGNGKSDLDHVISAKEIHVDRARVLAELNGVDLANSPENLQATNPRTNRTKKADSMEDFHKKYGEEYTDEQKQTMLKINEEARRSYEEKIGRAYYASQKFAKDVAFAAGDVGLRMGMRQALGLVLAEVWFSVKNEFEKIGDRFDLGELFSAISNGIKKGIENAKEKYKDILSRFEDGFISGMLSSITTTLLNIFSTTAKNIIKIIRQSYVSLVQAAKILFLNPDNLLFGERMRAVAKFIATGASVIAGMAISELIGKAAIGAIPDIGEVIQVFCSTLVTGIMSCSLLYFIDRNPTINKLVRTLDSIPSMEADVNYYRRQAEYFEIYAAELMEIDIDKFREETDVYNSMLHNIDKAKDENEFNIILKEAMKKIGIKIPWKGDFDSFMSDKNSVLVFE